MATFTSDRIIRHPFTGAIVYQPRYVYEAMASDTARVKLPQTIATYDIIELTAVPPRSTLLGFHLAFTPASGHTLSGGNFLLRAIESNIEGAPENFYILENITMDAPVGHWSPKVESKFFGYKVKGQADMDKYNVLVEDLQPLAIQLVSMGEQPSIPEGSTLEFTVMFQCGYNPEG